MMVGVQNNIQLAWNRVWFKKTQQHTQPQEYHKNIIYSNPRRQAHSFNLYHIMTGQLKIVYMDTCNLK